MKKTKTELTDLSVLRKKAEEQIKIRKKRVRKSESEDLEHELHVHEIALEIQNEQLQLTQIKLLESLKEYALLFESAPTGYFILDRNGIIENVNLEGCRLLGKNKRELTGKSFLLFFNNENHQDNFFIHTNFVFQSDEMHRFESEIKKKDGTVFPALIRSKKVVDEKNNFKHILTMLNDISDRREHDKKMNFALQKEKELNELKSRFISIASHEFRTPLTSILSSLSLLEQYMEVVPADKKQKHIERIKSSIWDLTIILDDFLSLERLETGKIEINKTKFNLIEFMKKFVDDTNGILKTNQTIRYVHTGENELETDKKILKHILLNLISNASKFSDEGKEINLISDVSDFRFTMKVIDQGIGIPVEEQTNLFTRFFRANNVFNIQGTGLGLNIVKRYVELLNGNINFKSEVNKGCSFFLTIPLH